MLLQVRSKYHPGYRVYRHRDGCSVIISPDDGETLYEFSTTRTLRNHSLADFKKIMFWPVPRRYFAKIAAQLVDITDDVYAGKVDDYGQPLNGDEHALSCE